MDAFDLHVEHRLGVEGDAQALLDQAGQGLLAVQALGGELLAEWGFVSKGIKVAQAPLRVIEHIGA
ncbi:hypothetical protein D9M71_795670 [compost metagenome]